MFCRCRNVQRLVNIGHRRNGGGIIFPSRKLKQEVKSAITSGFLLFIHFLFPKLELCLTFPVLSLTPSFVLFCFVFSAENQCSWSCDFVGSYHGLRPSNCCFSADGSLLAVSFGEVVTVWSVDTWGLLTTLCQPPGTIRWGL